MSQSQYYSALKRVTNHKTPTPSRANRPASSYTAFNKLHLSMCIQLRFISRFSITIILSGKVQVTKMDSLAINGVLLSDPNNSINSRTSSPLASASTSSQKMIVHRLTPDDCVV